jgi:hypothetical protein
MAKKTPVRSPSAPRDIPDAMRRGMTNAVIHGLIAVGALHRPGNLEEAGYLMWGCDDWHEALRRGLVW